MLPIFKNCCEVTVLKTVWYWQRTDRSVEQNREPRNRHINVTPSVNPIINYRPWVIITFHYGFILRKNIYSILVSAAENGEGCISICEGNGHVGNPDHSHIWYFVWGHSKIRLTGIVNWNAHIGISMQHELPQNMSSSRQSCFQHVSRFPRISVPENKTEAAGSFITEPLKAYSVIFVILYLSKETQAYPDLRRGIIDPIYWWQKCQSICDHVLKLSQTQKPLYQVNMW